jgi:hypothetical protein
MVATMDCRALFAAVNAVVLRPPRKAATWTAVLKAETGTRNGVKAALTEVVFEDSAV